ncbi:MAG: metal ABC transporter solute-binding protein, Zn/Mn family [Chlamydiales bacterium]
MRLFALFAFLLIGSFGCQPTSSTRETRKPTVLVSIVPYGYVVEQIAGKAVDVEIFVPRGADPHSYEPTPRQVETAHRAKLWLRIGEPFEERVVRALDTSHSALNTLEMWEELPLLPLEEGTHVHCAHEAEDRHVWLSPKLMKVQATRIKEALIELLPEQKLILENNCARFIHFLESLDQEISERLSPFKGQAILVSHSAFGYFCRDYQLIQLALECEGKEALPQKIASIMHEAEHLHVRCAIIQGQYGSKAVTLVAEKLHLPIFSSDPYAWDYLENLRTLSKVIADAEKNSRN